MAGALHHLGVHMGDRFDPPSHANPNGYFEDVEFKRLFDMMYCGKEVEELLRVQIRLRDGRPVWGVKDPKLCVVFNRFVRTLGADPKVVVVRRPPDQICDSMARAIGFVEPGRFLPLVEYYLERMEANLTDFGGHKLELTFDDVVGDGAATVAKLADFVGFPVSPEALGHIRGR